ncbi:7358_t:CDS:2, partial [Gigaspora margarita]
AQPTNFEASAFYMVNSENSTLYAVNAEPFTKNAVYDEAPIEEVNSI